MKNRGKLFKLQRKIGFIIAGLGFVVCLVNLFNLPDGETVLASFLKPSVSVLLGMVVVVFATALWDHKIMRFLQVVVVFAAGIVGILDMYNSIYGLGLVFLSVFLAFKYRYLEKRLKLKVGILLTVLFGIVEYSARRQTAIGKWMTGLDAILYISIFLLVSYLILKVEIQAALENQRRELLEPVDLDYYGITAAEMRVLEVLVTEKASDREIADQIFLSVGTVKNHIHQIKKKLGVTTRYAVIDMCRNNFKDIVPESAEDKTIEIKHFLEKENKRDNGNIRRGQVD